MTTQNNHIQYNHTQNLHTEEGAFALWNILHTHCGQIGSVLDIGCGRGDLLKAANASGVRDLIGIDGVETKEQDFLRSIKAFRKTDFREGWNLNRKFDLVTCLEVCEHLPESIAEGMVRKMTQHTDLVVFSAACPYQHGQGHINCQWPDYWQKLFNQSGFSCHDELRPLMTTNRVIEPWYRQNSFVAKRNPTLAGSEPRLPAYVLPEIYNDALRYQLTPNGLPAKYLAALAKGRLTTSNMLLPLILPFPMIVGLYHKITRSLARKGQ